MYRQDVPLRGLTTMGIGGPAREVCFAASVEELAEAVARGATVLGRGSNIIASDAGYAGLLAVTRFADIRSTPDGVYAQAGATFARTAAFCLNNGLSGLEWAAGIPGSVGGGAVMNAGAFGGDVASSVVYLEVLDGGIRRIEPRDCGFGYRASALRGVVTGVCFRVRGASREGIRALQGKYAAMRRASQPQGKSAGSVFKGGAEPAGKYIEQAGLKGMRMGGAKISELHANFIINDRGAAASDVKGLIRLAKEVVGERFGVLLQEEVRYLGEV